ncbi:uncharacterized protein LOC143889185 [Tasmannia lanceolata]|uniref:uncharacterized protein LOC143889185 n=1 Tax=Tasmannia lanceolata TaxID=3420 RepID=UPI004064ADBD
MDSDITNPNPNNCIHDEDVDIIPPNEELGVDREEEEELNSLLLFQNGEIAKRPSNSRRKVQWNDKNGNRLVEVLEFQPSDTSDSDEDEDTEYCICTVM